jgi:hypothetical protein
MVTLSTEVRVAGVNVGAIPHNTPLRKGLDLYFHVSSTTVAPPYEIYWKVNNRGPEAVAVRALRGRIAKDDGGLNRTKKQSTAYTGDHYVDVHVVKDGGVCVARAQQVVEIR